MRAALYEAGTTGLAIGDVDIDDPQPGRVRVRVHHCGICHSDYTVLAQRARREPERARPRGRGRRRRGRERA